MLNTSVERLEGAAVKLTVTVPAEEVDAAVDAAYKKIGGKVKISGFRPGKAPRPIIDRAVGRENVLAEATEELVNTTYPRAIDAEGLRPIEPAEMDALDTVVPGEDYTYEAQVETRPELSLSDTSNLEITLPIREATDKDVQEQVDMLRERFATLEPVEDRGVESGDFVLLSFAGTVDGEEYEGNVVDKYLYEMGRGLMPPEFDQAILGAKPAEARVAEFEIPDTSSNVEFVGKTARFDITIHEIKAKLMPEADDEFAENAGGFDSYEAMRESIRERVAIQKGSSWDHLKERSARELIASRLEGDVPEAMVTTRQQQIERDFMAMLEQREMSLQEYLSASGVDLATFAEDIQKQALQSVREELALEALYRAEGLEVTDEDIDAELSQMRQGTETAEEARTRWEELGLMQVIREQVMQAKAMNWVLDNIVVKEEEETAGDAAGAAAGTKDASPKKRASRAKKKAEEAKSDDAPETEE